MRYSNPFYTLSFIVELYIVFVTNLFMYICLFLMGACFALQIDIFQKKSSLLVVSCDLSRSGQFWVSQIITSVQPSSSVDPHHFQYIFNFDAFFFAAVN
ncbi:hypothetical protein T11_7654 [Trichinella zimbabwensis]|uniref:Uncharacterized protein n=1 Tax=Trichinella zimbabwensis TaxID=268475 RepID=A0A0V1I8Y2_9BILA|nr:hypothetical protein T11_7654 [Trichinella zimbabwensis]